MRHLACLLIPQDIVSRSPIITDTGRFRILPCEKYVRNGFRGKPKRGETKGWAEQTNILHDLDADL